MSPIIPELLGECRADARSLVSREYRQRKLVLAGSLWQTYKAYAGKSLVPFVAGLMTLLAYITNAVGDTFNDLVISGVVWAVVAGAIAYLVYVPIACYIAILMEKHEWNGGNCAMTGEPWQEDGRDRDTQALRFIAPTDRPVRIAGNIYFGKLRFEYHHTLHLTYTRPDTAMTPADKPIRRTQPTKEKRSLPLSLVAAAAIIIGSFWAVYLLAGLYSIIALSLVMATAVYVLCKLNDNTEFGSWTVVMSTQLGAFAIMGVDPGIRMFGAGSFMLGLFGLAFIAIMGLIAADK